MAKLSTEQRKEIPSSEYAWIDKHGGRHLPIENAAHVRDAMSRWPRTHFDTRASKEEARKKILAAAHKFGIEVTPTDKIARAG